MFLYIMMIGTSENACNIITMYGNTEGELAVHGYHGIFIYFISSYILIIIGKLCREFEGCVINFVC